jgi:LysR family transcriptional regulator, regulator for bpeEF and oprC
MDRLLGMEVFAKVVETGSFSRAAERTQLSKASVTSLVQNLESHLGVRLLNRTTRRLSLTDDGAAYYERCQRILSDVAETESALSRARVNPQGRLRVDMPVSIGRQYIVPALPRFAAQYPELIVQATLEDRVSDLIDEAIDAVIRVGTLADSSLVARRLYESNVVTCASPEFIARYGEPKTPEELANFNCLGMFEPGTARVRAWTMERGGERYSHEPVGNLHANHIESLIDAAISGAGIVRALDLLVNRQISAGLLKPILPDWRATRPISVAYPQNRHLSAKVRVFIDFVVALFPRKRREML